MGFLDGLKSKASGAGDKVGAAISGVKLLADAYSHWEVGREQGKYRKKARLAMDELQKLFDEIVPPDFDMKITDPPELLMEELSKPKYRTHLSRSNFDKSAIKSMGKYAPQAAKFIEEDAPELIKETETTRRGKEAQLRALDELDKVSRSSSDPQFRALIERAKKRVQSEAQTRGKSLESQYARRGMLGSGLQMAAQLGSDAEAMDRLGEMELDASAEAYRNRLNALMQGAELGGQIKRDDQDIQSKNNSIINSFNQRMSKRRQDLENATADMRNDAQLYNLKEAQRLEEANRKRFDDIVGEERRAAEFDITREDRNLDRDYRRRAMERDYLNNLRKYKSEWTRDERRNANDMLARDFQNKMARAKAMAGMHDRRDDMERGNVIDRARHRAGWGDLAKGAIDVGSQSFGAPSEYKGFSGSVEEDEPDWEKEYDYHSKRMKK